MIKDKYQLKSFILSIVRPMMTGKYVEQNQKNATINDLIPDGVDSNVRHASPFGFISRVPAGITAFYQALGGSLHENVSMNHFHSNRPLPSSMGETILYSTSPDGKTLKAKITLKSDGVLNIETPGAINITTTANVNVSCSNSTITASSKVSIASDTIELGSGSLEKIIKGETFMTFFNTHQHVGNLGYSTSPPTSPMTASQLSTHVKAT
jgi:phage gp45-like